MDLILKYINSIDAPAAIGPYSQAIALNGFLFMSGQLGLDPQSMILQEGIEAQTNQILQNIKAILHENQKQSSNVIKTTIFLIDMNHFNTVNIIYGNFFGDHRPARSCVAVKELPKQALIEIECIAW